MVKIAVVGGNEFIVGFELAGIKEVYEAGNEPFKSLKEMKGKKDIGIVVVDEKIMSMLDMHQRIEIESSVEPVFIELSTSAEQEGLKRLIKKSIGVDLLK